MHIDPDDMRDLDRYTPHLQYEDTNGERYNHTEIEDECGGCKGDYGFRTYQTLRTRVLAAHSHVEVTSVASRITLFAQDEEANPVYVETLVNLLMAQGYRVLERLTGESPTHDLMVTRLITRHVRTTVSVWQRTMESNNSQAPEG